MPINRFDLVEDSGPAGDELSQEMVGLWTDNSRAGFWPENTCIGMRSVLDRIVRVFSPLKQI